MPISHVIETPHLRAIATERTSAARSQPPRPSFRPRSDLLRRALGPDPRGDHGRRAGAYDDDLAYCRDLGLVARRDPLRIANPIYQEIIVRARALELKTWHDKKNPLDEGLAQLDGYLDRLGLETGVLAIFDRRETAPPPEERTRLEEARTPRGRGVTVLRG